jgi:hypothetical protein
VGEVDVPLRQGEGRVVDKGGQGPAPPNPVVARPSHRALKGGDAVPEPEAPPEHLRLPRHVPVPSREGRELEGAGEGPVGLVPPSAPLRAEELLLSPYRTTVTYGPFHEFAKNVLLSYWFPRTGVDRAPDGGEPFLNPSRRERGAEQENSVPLKGRSELPFARLFFFEVKTLRRQEASALN